MIPENETNYRREVKNLIDKIIETSGLTMQELSAKINVSVTSLSRWRNEKKSPRRKKYELLKQIAEGNSEPPPENKSVLSDVGNDQIADMKAQLESYRKDKNDMALEIAKLIVRVEALEEAVKKKLVHR